jgi:hypothetical protein
MALLLFHQRVAECYSWKPNYERICQRNKDFLLALSNARYATSAKERERTHCFLQAQVKGSKPMLKT